jgi:FRG domain
MAKGEPHPNHDRVIAVRSWRHFEELIADPVYRGWAFRGQSNADLPLYSALSRYFLYAGVHRDAWAGQEERILRIFQRKAHLFLTHVPPEGDSFQWLGLMQHHGAPTRLLDLTWSPYVAAFFALERGSPRSAVWAFNAPKINGPDKIVVEGGREVDLRPIGTFMDGSYERDFLKGTTPFAVIGEPKVMNHRLVAQSGTFLIPGVLDRPVDRILAGYRTDDTLVAKFEFDTPTLRADAMRALYAMNITYATLFPDLDGLARSMAYELEFHWGFDPRTMEPFPGFPPPHELEEWGVKGTRAKTSRPSGRSKASGREPPRANRDQRPQTGAGD